MKLKTDFLELNIIREKIGAELIPYQSTNEWQGKDRREILEKLRSREGLEGNIEDIDFLDKVSKYYDEVVLIYIKNQYADDRYGRKQEYKFHFSKCQTLSDFINKGKYNNKYVFTQRQDGVFIVNLLRNNEIIKKDEEMPMKPCKNCLKNTNYKNYGKGGTSGRHYKSNSHDNSVYDNFDVKEFFEIYTHQEVVKPRHTPETAPLDIIYPEEWSNISKMKKDNENYICAECKIDFKPHPDFVHTHHIDGRPSNNNSQNLKVLCICCHAEQGGIGHDRLKSQANYKLCLDFRKEKGIY